MLDQKIRICLKSYNPATLTRSCNKIIDTLEQNGGSSSGIIPLPTKRKRYCVLRSPHVDKKSREQFEIRIHKRILDVTAPSTEAFNALIKLDLESGVDIEVKL